ncbi:unnamed protein product [Fusarium graminearum]|uniref:Uncharacterized protein n=1 Tax=Gibberella zeae TaxID=5518 RepID=A0A4U9ERJ7_GIBZA|nr:unnamed protein product [Fusarium graminearum]CZS73717.1 unnamed protein product [Fusarium graminearum]VTO85947.1 unnamed protein product [Fusarium graminearum]
MSSNTTTSLLLPEYRGHFVAEVVGADPTATTFVLDCDWDKYPWDGDDDCHVTKRTFVVGPWADKTPTPEAPTKGIYKEIYVEKALGEEVDDFSFSAECQMSKTWAETCTTVNIGGNARYGVTATFPRATGMVLDEFYDVYGYGAFDWVPVTVTAGQKYLSSAKTTVAASTEAYTTRDAQPAKETITGGEPIKKDVITLEGKASPTETTASGACAKRVLSLWGLVGLVAAVGFS